MRVAFISDVHANFPALSAVLSDLPDVQRVVHAGDIVGYNPFPQRVIDRFRTLGIESIAGNHDRGLVDPSAFEFHPYARAVLDWTRDELTDDDVAFVKDLPSTLEIALGGDTITVVHGSPGGVDDYLYPTDLTLDLIHEISESTDVFVWGHTHYPLITSVNGVLLVNPGSVGQPRDGDWRASYAVWDSSDGTVELRRCAYDVTAVVEKLRAESLPSECIESLRKPDDWSSV
jgi:putative phosphoesterase